MIRRFLFLILTFSLVFPIRVQADDRFALSANLKYEVHSDGNTTVTQQFTLTNNANDYYVQKYQVAIGDSEIYNLHASDDQGLLTLNQIKTGKQLSAEIFFRQPVLGFGKSYQWLVTYDTPSIASKVGRLWQVKIPQPQLASETIPYTTSLIVPTSFGPAVFTSPQTPNLTWLEPVKKTGYSAVFDPNPDISPYQAYDFRLTYQLYNSRLYPVIAEVPLPPDTEYQKIYLSYLNPRPQDVVVTPDGNWLARYYLGAVGRLEIIASGSAAVQINPTLKPFTLFSQATYTEEQPFWPAKDTLIRLKSQQLGTSDAVFDYTVNRINLTGANKSRLGAQKVFLSSQGTNSLDLADVFVTMNRSLTIPTKEITGLVWQAQKPVLQSWVAFYNQQNLYWQMADPYQAKLLSSSTGINSWDFNHLVLALYGQDSGLPNLPVVPDQVVLTPVSRDLSPNQLPKIAYHANVPSLATAGFPISATVFLENLGPTLSPGEILNLDASQITLTQKSINSGPMPPFAVREINLPVEPTGILSDNNAIISLTISGHHETHNLTIQPLYKSKFVIVLGGLTIAGFIAIATQITRGLFFQKRRRPDSLRRQGQ